MGDFLLEIADIHDQIALAREALRTLIEQVAAASGDESDELVAERIAGQQEQLEALIKRHDDVLERAIRERRTERSHQQS
jgi:hypothetical protein